MRNLENKKFSSPKLHCSVAEMRLQAVKEIMNLENQCHRVVDLIIILEIKKAEIAMTYLLVPMMQLIL